MAGTNYKNALKLYHRYSMSKGEYFYNLPQKIIDSIFNNIDGKNGNAIKIMIVLLGTIGDGSFGISEKYMCDRTGITAQNYYRARKFLENIGFITIEGNSIIINIDRIINSNHDDYKISHHQNNNGNRDDDLNTHRDDFQNSNRDDEYNKEEQIKNILITYKEDNICKDIEIIRTVLNMFKNKKKYKDIQQEIIYYFDKKIDFNQIKNIIDNRKEYESKISAYDQEQSYADFEARLQQQEMEKRNDLSNAKSVVDAFKAHGYNIKEDDVKDRYTYDIIDNDWCFVYSMSNLVDWINKWWPLYVGKDGKEALNALLADAETAMFRMDESAMDSRANDALAKLNRIST